MPSPKAGSITPWSYMTCMWACSVLFCVGPARYGICNTRRASGSSSMRWLVYLTLLKWPSYIYWNASSMESRSSRWGRKAYSTVTASFQTVIPVSDRACVVRSGGGTDTCVLSTGGLLGAILTGDSGEGVSSGIGSMKVGTTFIVAKRMSVGICVHVWLRFEISTNAKTDRPTSSMPLGTDMFLYAVSDQSIVMYTRPSLSDLNFATSSLNGCMWTYRSRRMNLGFSWSNGSSVGAVAAIMY